MLVVYQQLLLLTLNRFLFNTPDYDVTEKEHVLTILIITFRRTVVIKNCKGKWYQNLWSQELQEWRHANNANTFLCVDGILEFLVALCWVIKQI